MMSLYSALVTSSPFLGFSMSSFSSGFITILVQRIVVLSALISKINYKDYKFLRKFITEQGKIIPGFVTGVSSKYQRSLTKEIKKARNIALLPYVNDPRNT